MGSLLSSGSLLLSMPGMLDPNFMHTVVLLVDHTPLGAMGLVLNRQLQADLGGLMSERTTSSFAVYGGGPVEGQTLNFIHRLPQLVTGGVNLGQGLYFGGDLEAMLAAVDDPRAERSLRIFLGSSGWGPGQLEGELGAGSWRVAPPDLDSVFREGTPEVVWRGILSGLDEQGDQLSRLPPDVSWN